MKRLLLSSLIGACVIMAIAGCGPQQNGMTHEAIYASLDDKMKAALERSNDPKEIDKEFKKRLTSTKKAVDKIVSVEGDKIIVTHKLGKTVMPKEHKRIVVIRAEDPMIALDEPFIAANYNENSYLYNELKERNIQNFSINDETRTINYEQIQALKPDLIIMRDSYGKAAYEALSKIAPTITFNVNKEEVALLGIATALGVPEKGEARLKEYYNNAKKTRIALGKNLNGETVGFLRIMNKEIRLYPYMKNDINNFMADLLNIKPPDMALETELNPTNSAISLERLPDLDAKYLIVTSGYGASTSNNQGIADQRLANLKKDELWKNLPVVKADHVLQVDSTLWMAHGIIAKERAMKELYDTWGK